MPIVDTFEVGIHFLGCFDPIPHFSTKTHVNDCSERHKSRETTKCPSKRGTEAVRDLRHARAELVLSPGPRGPSGDPAPHHTSIKLAPDESSISHLKWLPEDLEVPFFFLFPFISRHGSQPFHGNSQSWPLPVFALVSSPTSVPLDFLSWVMILGSNWKTNPQLQPDHQGLGKEKFLPQLCSLPACAQFKQILSLKVPLNCFLTRKWDTNTSNNEEICF